MASAVAVLREFLDRHERVLVLTGAGISAPSGIPDYRDADGAWKHRKPMTFAEFTGSASARRRYWAGSLRGWPRVRDARPNPAHRALAELEARGRISAVITQNVDGLHQRAGSRKVNDLHGRLDTVLCLDCGGQVDREDVQRLLVAWNPRFAGDAEAPPAERPESRAGVDGEVAGADVPRPDGDTDLAGAPHDLRIPDCPACGGVLKPGVVFFGENVPRSRVEAATEALEAAAALLVVGSSLMVYSGYRFVRAARERGRPIMAVNLGKTRADAELDVKIVADCAEVLGQAAVS